MVAVARHQACLRRAANPLHRCGRTPSFGALDATPGLTPCPRAIRFCRQFAALSSLPTSPSYTPDEEHVDVLVSQANIKRITPTGTADLPPGATVFERARGSFVSSALTDIFLLQTLRHGITVVRDAGDPDGTATPAALACIASGALPGPEIHYAYGFANAPPARSSNSFVYDDPAQAPGIIKRLQFLGAASVKSYENLDLPRTPSRAAH
jgi:hypothetical protein